MRRDRNSRDFPAHLAICTGDLPADTERFMRTFKEEVVSPNEFASFEEAHAVVEEFFRFYNEGYPQSTLGGMSPFEFEASLTTGSTEIQATETAAA